MKKLCPHAKTFPTKKTFPQAMLGCLRGFSDSAVPSYKLSVRSQNDPNRIRRIFLIYSISWENDGFQIMEFL